MADKPRIMISSHPERPTPRDGEIYPLVDDPNYTVDDSRAAVGGQAAVGAGVVIGIKVKRKRLQ